MIRFDCKSKVCGYSSICDDPPFSCPECGNKSYRLTFLKELPRKTEFVNIGYKDNPRWSWAMGVNVEDIPREMEKHPDREYHPGTGQLRVKNRPEKKRLMKEHGYYD